MSKFIESADSRDTSVEVMQAIFRESGMNEKEAERIWAEPTDQECKVIDRLAREFSGHEDDELFWGGSEI